MTRIVRCIGLALLLMAHSNCSRITGLRQERMERQLKARVMHLVRAEIARDCDALMQMHDRWFREHLIAAYRQALCEPGNELADTPLSFRKIIFSDDGQAGIVEFTVHYAMPVEGKTSYDGVQSWISESGNWYIVDQESNTILLFLGHFAISKNFDPTHPAFYGLPQVRPR